MHTHKFVPTAKQNCLAQYPGNCLAVCERPDSRSRWQREIISTLCVPGDKGYCFKSSVLGLSIWASHCQDGYKTALPFPWLSTSPTIVLLSQHLEEAQKLNSSIHSSHLIQSEHFTPHRDVFLLRCCHPRRSRAFQQTRF